MGVQAIDQNIFPEVLGKTKVFYCPRLGTIIDNAYRSVCEISGRPVDRVYVNSHQSMQKPIDEDRLSMKK
jgi:hypothetical protein